MAAEQEDTGPETSHPIRGALQRLGLLGGPGLAALTWLALPEAPLGADGTPIVFGAAGRATAAAAVWMAVWWLSEAIPVYATALLPLVLLPLAGARSMAEAAAPFAHPLIFLFMGGFLIALTMERWGLHRRLALRALRAVGDRPSHMVAGFMGVTAVLSMWVSNSATAVMMLPVACSVIALVGGPMCSAVGADEGAADAHRPDSPVRPFALALLLGIAYGASIGGIGTPIGTPPNLFLLSYVRDHLGREISFVRWMSVALPLVAVFLPIAWWLLTRVLFPSPLARIPGWNDLVGRSLAALGPMGRGERITLVVFVGAAFLWVTRPLLSSLSIAGVRPFAGLTDAGIAMLAALSLFVWPVDWRARTFALDWESAVRLPWGVLLLFGGGLSLAAAIQANGVGELLASRIGALAGLPSLVIVLAVTTGVVFLTELTSNTATTATLVPILAALAPGLGLDPLLLIVPAALAASCAFMLPVATPPNAVVFGSGWVGIPEMSRAGFWLNWIGVVLITALVYTVALPRLAGG
ncbi:MAG: DASS family sodium-coupled anion symporter [Myxococcales bacterium]|nr:DASS family sodium-coupled anion symporter [Myxococcales bacterium]